MKKSLVALATLAATGAMAQVSITGLLDAAYIDISGNVAATAKGSSIVANEGSATSNIAIAATEDLGGGLKSTVRYEIDPRGMFNNAGLYGTQVLGNSGLGRHQMFVELAGGFGAIKLGSPNSISFGAWNAGTPFTTATGGGYTRVAVNAANGQNRIIGTRYDRSVRYDSPNLNGFVVSALYAPGNDVAQTQSGTPNTIPNNRQVTEFGATYANGPLNVAFASLRGADQTNAGVSFFGVNASTVANPNTWALQTSTVGAGGSTTYNTLSANYKVGATTLYASVGSGDLFTDATTSAKSNNVAVKHDIGTYSLLASYRMHSTKAGAAAEVDQKITGLRLENNLSKTTAVYAMYESWDNGAATANKQNMAGVGIRKSF